MPASNNSKVHRCANLISPHRLEGFVVVPNDGAKLLNIIRIESDLGASERIVNVQIRKILIIAAPKLPVEGLDTVIPSSNDLVNRSGSHRRLALELQSERYRNLTTLFKDSHIDQVGRSVVHNLGRSELGVVQTIRTSSSIRNNRFRLAVREAHNNLFVRTRKEETTNRIGDVRRALNDARRSNESLEPVQFGTGETGKPRDVGRKRFAELVDNLFR